MTKTTSRHLLDILAEVPDSRNNRGKRHPLSAILGLAVIAMMCGNRRSYAAIAEWGRTYHTDLPKALGFRRTKIPCASTLHYVFKDLDATALATFPKSWQPCANLSEVRLFFLVTRSTVITATGGLLQTATNAPLCPSPLCYPSAIDKRTPSIDESLQRYANHTPTPTCCLLRKTEKRYGKTEQPSVHQSLGWRPHFQMCFGMRLVRCAAPALHAFDTARSTSERPAASNEHSMNSVEPTSARHFCMRVRRDSGFHARNFSPLIPTKISRVPNVCRRTGRSSANAA